MGTLFRLVTPTATPIRTPIPTPPPSPSPPPPPPSPSPTPPIPTSPPLTGSYQGSSLATAANAKVFYYKIDLYNTKTNIYGESTEKWYYPLYEVRCFIDRGAITNTDTEYGVDVSQIVTITVPIDIFASASVNMTPEVGDIFMEQEKYYEVSSIDRQFITIPGTISSLGTPGYIVTYVISAYLTRTSKLNLIKYST
jgi:hypothetical protein